jgi:uncharacterized protein YdaU (DUF1376 family)
MAKKHMPLRQDPAYRLYTSDFLVRNSHMTDDQVGKYIRLICWQHQNGHIPETVLKSQSKEDPIVMEKYLVDDNGRYYDLEVELEVQRRLEVRTTKVENANARWKKNKNEDDLTETPF